MSNADAESLAKVPQELKSLDRWIVWRYEEDPDRPNHPKKVPFNIRNGSKLNATKVENGYSFDLITHGSNGYSGAGFILGEPVVGADFDKCRDPLTGEVAPRALAEVMRLNSYAEISPSQTGIKVFGKGKLNGERKRSGLLEMYGEGRYFTVTGQHLPGTPTTLNTFDASVLNDLQQRMLREEFKTWADGEDEQRGSEERFVALMHGDWQRHYGSQSEADLALTTMLAYRHAGDACVIDEEFRKSGLMRKKWDDRHGRATYGQLTIQKAVESYQRPPGFSDDALALRFTETYGDTTRYTAAWSRWSTWDASCWKRDETLHVFDMVRDVCRVIAKECPPALRARILSAATIAAIERLVRADRRHAATVEQWDRDPWLLNTPEGIVDLRTGEIRPHDRQQYLTKLTAIAPNGKCPLWLVFLDRITSQNPELQKFLQRMCGYGLTGLTTEHAFFFLHGPGANGKSVFLNTISGALGDYAKTAPIEAFVATTGERHPTELAGLAGARWVTAIEVEEGRRWAESKIKAMTGGDRIAARFMRQDFFEFQPQFKLLIAANQKPSLRSVDEAIRRRLYLVPFAVTIPEKERDRNLTEKLRAEWPGILAWAVEGCLAWQRDGLEPPSEVRAATSDYLSEEDALGRWVEDECVVERTCTATTAELFRAWCDWCDRCREFPGPKKTFIPKLKDRYGLTSTQLGVDRLRGFIGIGLRAPANDSTNDV